MVIYDSSSRGGSSPFWDLQLARSFCFGYSSTTMLAMDEWMGQFERACMNCVNPLLFRAFMVSSHGTRGGLTSPPGGSAVPRLFCFGYSSTTKIPMVKWMQRFERAHLNCVSSISVGAFMVISHCGGGRSSQFWDLQLARLFVLGIAPSPHQLWTNGCDGSKEHI